MDILDARTALAGRGWLSRTPAAFRDAILAQARLRSFPAGATVYAEGDPSDGLWGLASGMIGLELAGAKRSPSLAYLSGKGFWIGAHTLVMGPGRQIGIVALRPSHLLFVSGSAFHAIAQKDPEAWRWLAMLPLMQNAVAFGILDDLLISESDRRCAAILLRLAGCRGPFAQAEPDDIYVTQEQLGEMSNLSRTTVGDVLRTFEKQGFITRRYGRIVIDSSALARVVTQG